MYVPASSVQYKYQLTIKVWIYFWTLYSVPLISVSSAYSSTILILHPSFFKGTFTGYRILDFYFVNTSKMHFQLEMPSKAERGEKHTDFSFLSVCLSPECFPMFEPNQKSVGIRALETEPVGFSPLVRDLRT